MIRFESEAAIASLHAMNGALTSNVTQAFGQVAEFALQMVKVTDRFRNRTGNLRASFARKRGGPFLQFVQAGSRKAFYAGFVEFGTVHMAPRRYMQTTRDRAELELAKHVERGVIRAVE